MEYETARLAQNGLEEMLSFIAVHT